MGQTELFIKMVMDRWNASLKNFDKIIDELPDEALLREVAPGKNRGVYLLGHMIAVHDDMFVLLDIGEKMYPELHRAFVESPDKQVTELPEISTLRTQWKKQTEVLNQKLAAFSADNWFEKHTAVSADDFTKEPHRNKLNIIITRTTHLQYHIGQLVLLK